jgi:long-chain acyl-CoA synthetase
MTLSLRQYRAAMNSPSDHHLARLAERSYETRGDYPALLFEDHWHTSGELFDRASRIATGLSELGVKPGDRVVVTMANCPEVGIAYNAIWRAGAVVTPAMFLLPADALAHIISDAGARAVITTPEFVDKVREAVAWIDSVAFIASTGEATDDVLALTSLESAAPGTIVPRLNDDLAALLYTGGTTGRSKGVMLSHEGLYYTGNAAHEAAHVPGVNRALGTLPLSHAYGILVTLAGMHNPEPGIAVLLRWFTPEAFLELIPEHQLQISAVVPSILQILLTYPLEEHDLEPAMGQLRWRTAPAGGRGRVLPPGPVRLDPAGLRVDGDGRADLDEPGRLRAPRLGRPAGARLHRRDRRRRGQPAAARIAGRDRRLLTWRDAGLLALTGDDGGGTA